MPPTLNEYWCGIANVLKQGHCLVYIMWSGALEMVNGTHHPPMKKLIRLLADRPLRINDSHGTNSVMHRLIFLQLGSKGTVDNLLSNTKSITLFWEKSADEDSFDAKLCAQSVCKEVKARLKAHSESKQGGGLKMPYFGTAKQPLKTGRAVRGESVDGSDSNHHKSTGQPEQVSLDTINILGDRIGGKIAKDLTHHSLKQHEEVIGRLDGIDKAVEFVGEKVVENQLADD